MGQDWIIGVLADLRSFAAKNDLPLLSAKLEEASSVASAELARRKDPAKLSLVGDTPAITQMTSGTKPG